MIFKEGARALPLLGLGRPVQVPDDDTPIRSQTFDVHRLEQHARTLAESQKPTGLEPRARNISVRLTAEWVSLQDSHRALQQASASGEQLTAAAEWLVDNFHLLQQQVEQIRADLPPRYYSQLPKITDDHHLAGYPQVFAMTWAYIAHGDSHFEPSTFSGFVNAYQEIRALSIGELWALPIHLRVTLLENAARMARRIVVSLQARAAADGIVKRINKEEASLDDIQSDFAQLTDHARLSYLVHLIRRLRDERNVSRATLTMLARTAHDMGHDLDSAVHEEHARQAFNNVTMQNLFGSLKNLGDQDWEQWFGDVSHVDRILRADPDYATLDPPTRSAYRREVEDLSRHSPLNEVDVAQRLLAGDGRSAGDQLLGAGRPGLERQIGYRAPAIRKLRTLVRASGVGGYAGAILLLALGLVIMGIGVVAGGTHSTAFLIAITILAIAPGFDAAMAMVNYFITQLLTPVVLPAYAFEDGIPKAHRTLIAMPAMITSFHTVEQLVKKLESHYLSNNDEQLYYALITDWRDADAEHEPEDADLLKATIAGITSLGERHGCGRFMLFHRARLWNASEGRWMGWERKRGKLQELNRILRGATDTNFIHQPAELPNGVRYVIVLDADTVLPRGAARRLVAKMAHPLNRPVITPGLDRVTSGYGIMQPRVTISLPDSGRGTIYQRIYSSRPGIDPYVFAVSDVYQDMFGEGSFTGKGIYDIDAFEIVMAGRVPENTMLSHDLFEGNFARAAFVSDVEVVEDFPERYLVDVARHHRWARGDWQLLPWITTPYGGRTRGLTALGRWKMLDNLRRTLTPAFTIAAMIMGWYALPQLAAFAWTFFILGLVFVPAFVPIFAGGTFRRERITIESEILTLRDDVFSAIQLTVSRMIFLADQAFVMLGAIARTLYRLFASRQHLLEWTAAAQIQSGPPPNMRTTYGKMAASPALGAILILVLISGNSHGAWAALPFALAWVAAPALAYRFSSRQSFRPRSVSDEAAVWELRKISRRTWRYFEEQVTPGDNMLPPDNFQEDPLPVTAHRTSPTNIGLYLLSTVAAHEMGWIGRDEAIYRLGAALESVARLEKHRGHLFNWYDTQNLKPLEPRYVSTVDSGNFAGHLIALANACEAWQLRATAAKKQIDGIIDVAEILKEELDKAGRFQLELSDQSKAAATQVDTIISSLAEAKGQRGVIAMRLVTVSVQINSLDQAIGRILANAKPGKVSELHYWGNRLRAATEAMLRDATASASDALKAGERLGEFAVTCRQLAYGMDYAFLLNQRRHLLSIGYQVNHETLDPSCYDLLASEAALASFFAIAKGDVATQHWFKLGRPVVPLNHAAALVSWSGSMFEYLMPNLVLDYPDTTLLHQTTKLVVQRQIAYGRKKETPWGISEAAYAARDLQFTYQYSNFGVPGLGLKKGLGSSHVIAPYATGLAAMIAPGEAVENYKRLEAIGARGRLGYYESIDFTPERIPEGQPHVMVKAYFAHHQGMTIVSIFNAATGGAMRAYFHAENTTRATELLLQERAPNHVPLKAVSLSDETQQTERLLAVSSAARRIDPRDHVRPLTNILSNGRYTVMMTAAGAGYSRWNGIAINRWREDPTRDDWGMKLFLRDTESGARWSVGLEPRLPPPDEYAAIFSQEKSEFQRAENGIRTELECLVSTEQDAEARSVNLVNMTSNKRVVEMTSYMELALADPAADDAHPAFSKMFVVTEFVPEFQAVIATRRQRTAADPVVWAAQFMVSDDPDASAVLEFETSREAFLGRGNAVSDAIALRSGKQLGGTVGSTLDPVMALRIRLEIPSHRKVRCVIWTVAAESREALLECVGSHRSMAALERVQVLAWTQSRILLRHLSCDVAKANAYQQLGSRLIYSSPDFRPEAGQLRANARPQANLWALSISGTRPILLIRIRSAGDIAAVEDAVLAQLYWQEKGLAVDLVIMNEQPTSYLQDLQAALDRIVVKFRGAEPRPASSQQGELFVLRGDLLSLEQIDMLMAAAHVVLKASQGTIEEQLAGEQWPDTRQPRHVSRVEIEAADDESADDDGLTGKLTFFNGFGGFDRETGEYVIRHDRRRPLPAPWINVLSNPRFGSHCSAEGGGYSWYGNSREFQISPWSNDPLNDLPGEAFYIRDMETGRLLSPTVLPLGRRAGRFTTRHGFGTTIQEGVEHDLVMEQTQVVAQDDSLKRVRLKLTNLGNQERKLCVTFMAELVAGQRRSAAAHHVSSEVDRLTDALLVQNPWNNNFGNVVIFADMNGQQSSMTANRLSVLGAMGSLATPAGLRAARPLQSETGGGHDPCIALQQIVRLPGHGGAEVVLAFGAADSAPAARDLVRKYRTILFETTLVAVRSEWTRMLGTIQVHTPDPAFDIMMNGWLAYQTIACRLWARSGFYQASGAYGFRDQLQDSMTVAHFRPDLSRRHILEAASRQFVEGDVQHWWLPSNGAGVRTRISDDTVWLAYCTAYYVSLTGDASILDEQVAFLEGPQLHDGQHDVYAVPGRAAETAALYDHCVRGLRRNMSNGVHGLPLMGTGDWNDGMNRVGEQGKGESVWLGWFLYHTLEHFEKIATARGATAQALEWSGHRAKLKTSLDEQAWDGEWYRRAYFDDGTALGTSSASECRIDAIAQSWAVISGAANPAKATAAMKSVERHLIREDGKLALLFTPPFQASYPNPGYIQSYPPGIRENGGQYTHGATWSIFALAALQDTEGAMALFSLINPINHARDTGEAMRYRIEPYVMAGDVYGEPPFRGRGGWSWYTGAAGWTYRAGLEAILGFKRSGKTLLITPCVPKAWQSYEVSYRFGDKTLLFVFSRSHGDNPTNPGTIMISRNGVYELDLNIVDASKPILMRLD